jgi:hypothetical protein
MSLLPKEILLIKCIKEQHAYCDYKSVEKAIDKTKKKYKVSAKPIKISQNLYPFFILTTEMQACQGCLTVCINTNHWEDRQKNHLERTSYLDIKKIDILDEEEVISKIKDCKNGFPLVARLCDIKYKEVKDKKNKLYLASRISEISREIIQQALSESEEELTDKVLEGLDLK